MKAGIRQSILGTLCVIATAGTAQASSPAEKLVCSKAPRAEWLSEAKISEIFGAKNYELSKLKVSRGNCYEFYAIDHDGSIVEAYYHPVSGAVMRHNRVMLSAASPSHDSHPPASPTTTR